MTCVLLRCACPDYDTAHGIAHALVEGRVAACVHVLPPVHSVFRWNGQVQEGQEVVLEVKTTADAAQRATSQMQSLHPYACPVIEQSTIVLDSRAEAWLRAQIG